jgi:hypothetical protein
MSRDFFTLDFLLRLTVAVVAVQLGRRRIARNECQQTGVSIDAFTAELASIRQDASTTDAQRRIAWFHPVLMGTPTWNPGVGRDLPATRDPTDQGS